MFDGRIHRSPESELSAGPTSGSKLFEKLISTNPSIEAGIARALGCLALEVAVRGGRMSLVAEGPEQGITIEIEGKTTRIDPSRGLRTQKASMADTLDIYVEAVRSLIEMDNGLRG